MNKMGYAPGKLMFKKLDNKNFTQSSWNRYLEKHCFERKVLSYICIWICQDEQLKALAFARKKLTTIYIFAISWSYSPSLIICSEELLLRAEKKRKKKKKKHDSQLALGKLSRRKIYCSLTCSFFSPFSFYSLSFSPAVYIWGGGFIFLHFLCKIKGLL